MKMTKDQVIELAKEKMSEEGIVWHNVAGFGFREERILKDGSILPSAWRVVFCLLDSTTGYEKELTVLVDEINGQARVVYRM